MGIALVGEPRVMFLDEPTSGLDSFTGGEVMQVIKVRCCRLRPVCEAFPCLKMHVRYCGLIRREMDTRRADCFPGVATCHLSQETMGCALPGLPKKMLTPSCAGPDGSGDHADGDDPQPHVSDLRVI